MPIQYCDLELVNPVVENIAINGGSSETFFVPERVIYDFEIMYVIHGQCEVVEENRKYTIRKDDFHLMKPFVRHKRYIRPGNNCFYYNMHLDFVYIPENPRIDVERLYAQPCFERTEKSPVIPELMERKILMPKEFEGFSCKHINDSNRLISCFAEIQHAFDRKKIADKFFLKSKVMELFQILFEDQPESPKRLHSNKDIVSEFIGRMTKAFDRELEIGEFCREYGVSQGHFRKIFKEMTGKSPVDYQIDLRMEFAAEQLRGGDLSVKEISGMVGYSDPYYFSRLFKSRLGVSPTHYGRERQEEDESNGV